MHLRKRVLRGPTNGGAYIQGGLHQYNWKGKSAAKQAEAVLISIYCRSYMKNVINQIQWWAYNLS